MYHTVVCFCNHKNEIELNSELQKYILYELLKLSFAMSFVRLYIFTIVTIYDFTLFSFQYKNSWKSLEIK